MAQLELETALARPRQQKCQPSPTTMQPQQQRRPQQLQLPQLQPAALQRLLWLRSLSTGGLSQAANGEEAA